MFKMALFCKKTSFWNLTKLDNFGKYFKRYRAMGGYGSSRWGWHYKKRTIEESLQLDTGFLVKCQALKDGASGACRWGQSSVNWKTEALGEGKFLYTLSYAFKREDKRGSVRLPVWVFSTQMPKGGVRYWFHCPLKGCKKPKVRKLYLPTGATYFGCRQCHGLVYSSSQESRKPSQFILALGMREGLSAKEVRKIWSR